MINLLYVIRAALIFARLGFIYVFYRVKLMVNNLTGGHMKLLAGLIFTLTLLTSTSYAADINGVAVASSVMQGKKLSLIGAGTRVKWFFDVYVMAAYQTTKSCDTKTLIKNDDDRYLKITMIRDVSAEKMGGALEETLSENLSKDASAELKKQVKELKSYFTEDLKKGQVIEFKYVKSKGTTTFVNSKEVGTLLKGFPFSELLWRAYFGSKTCCSTLKSEILSYCKKN